MGPVAVAFIACTLGEGGVGITSDAVQSPSRLLAPADAAITQPGDADSPSRSLQSEVIRIASIDPRHEDDSDLMPLRDLIGSARVVVLGEATHSDGAASRAKARLAIFLHRQMGFDVLAWESGLAQCHGMNAAIRNPQVPLNDAAAYLMSGGWAQEEGIWPLFEHARATWTTGRPLQMSGFDTGRPHMGPSYTIAFLRGVFDRHPSIGCTDDEWVLVSSLMSRAFGFLGGEAPPEQEHRREIEALRKLYALLETRRDELLTVASPRDLILAERFITHALACDDLKTGDRDTWAMRRDELMADTFLWLIRELYPDRKIIVWAATSHFIRNSSNISNADHPDWYTQEWEAGNRIWRELGDDVYTIAFTSLAGELGHIFPEGWGMESQVRAVSPAPPGSIEAIAGGVGHASLFLDLRRLPREHWLRNRQVSVSLGRLTNEAHWPEIVDAFFWFERSEPVRYRPKP